MNPPARVCENIVKQSGLSWTIVRASWFSQNFSEGLFHEFIINKKISLPVSTVKEPFIDIDDIADIVIDSLLKPKHTSKLYEVTGPELLSFEQLASRFSSLLQTQVVFEQVTMEAFQTQLRALNIDPGAIEMLTYLFGEVLDGRNEYLSDGVEQALGRKPTNFNQFVLNNSQAFEAVS